MKKYSAGVLFGEELEALYKDAKDNQFALPAVNTIGTNTINAVLETAAKVREKLAALKPRDEPAESTTDDTEPLIGKWVHKSSSGFVGEDEFLADGTFRSRIGYGTWKKVGSFIETTVGRYVDYYRLPVRDGKLYGTNENGTFSIILTEIPR